MQPGNRTLRSDAILLLANRARCAHIVYSMKAQQSALLAWVESRCRSNPVLRLGPPRQTGVLELHQTG
jgi:hypothetical protein